MSVLWGLPRPFESVVGDNTNKIYIYIYYSYHYSYNVLQLYADSGAQAHRTFPLSLSVCVAHHVCLLAVQTGREHTYIPWILRYVYMSFLWETCIPPNPTLTSTHAIQTNNQT